MCMQLVPHSAEWTVLCCQDLIWSVSIDTTITGCFYRMFCSFHPLEVPPSLLPSFSSFPVSLPPPSLPLLHIGLHSAGQARRRNGLFTVWARYGLAFWTTEVNPDYIDFHSPRLRKNIHSLNPQPVTWLLVMSHDVTWGHMMSHEATMMSHGATWCHMMSHGATMMLHGATWCYNTLSPAAVGFFCRGLGTRLEWN